MPTVPYESVSLFFKTDKYSVNRVLDQSKLMEWRFHAIPSVFALITLPVGVPITIVYKRKGKTFIPTACKVESYMLTPAGGTMPIKNGFVKKIQKLDLPVLEVGQYNFLDTFKVKAVVTIAASKVRKLDSPKTFIHDSGKKTAEKLAELPVNPFPKNVQDFMARIIDKPIFHFYDVDRRILNIMNPLFDICNMSKKISTPCTDQNSTLYARMDATSAYGFRAWASEYRIRRRKDKRVILSSVNGRNLWAHNQYVVCGTVNENRVAMLDTEISHGSN